MINSQFIQNYKYVVYLNLVRSLFWRIVSFSVPNLKYFFLSLTQNNQIFLYFSKKFPAVKKYFSLLFGTIQIILMIMIQIEIINCIPDKNNNLI